MARFERNVAAAVMAVAVAAASVAPARAADVKSRLQDRWQSDIAKSAGAQDGCFKAEYPSTTWRRVPCVKVAPKPFRHSQPVGAPHNNVVGNGDDYTALANGSVAEAFGQFLSVKGLTSETDNGQADIYSLQLNSEFFTTSACSGATNPSQCQGWAQFVYSSGEQSAFIQYWLIGYGNTCPTTPYNDWNQSGGSCYRNSPGVAVAKLPITSLSTEQVRGFADAKRDSIVMVVGTTAYRAGGSDDVNFLSQHWTASEFNVFGDASSSQGDFNAGTVIWVSLVQQDGSGKAPGCTGKSGTTGETTNLTLHPCKMGFSHVPFIDFVERN